MASKRTEMLRVRLRRRQMISWRAAAKRADLTLSEYVCTIVDAHIEQGSDPPRFVGPGHADHV